MSKKALVSLMIVLVTGTTSAQFFSYIKSYGGPNFDYGSDFLALSDGGYLVVGGTGSYGQGASDQTPNAHILRTDADGARLWSKSMGGPNYDELSSVVQMSNGDFLATGKVDYGTTNGDGLLTRFTASGTVYWNKRIGTTTRKEILDHIVALENEEFLVVGSRMEFGGGTDGNVLVVKVDATGAAVWTLEIGSGDQDDTRAVMRTSDGGFLITGVRYALPITEGFCIKIDANGTLEWDRKYQLDGGSVFASGIVESTAGNYLVTCGGLNGALILLCINGDGDVLWNRAFRDGDSFSGSSITAVGDGTFLVTGSVSRENYTVQSHNCVLFNEVGDVLAYREFGDGLANMSGSDAESNVDGSFTLLGGIELNGGDISLVRCSADDHGLGALCHVADGTLLEIEAPVITGMQAYTVLVPPVITTADLGGVPSSSGLEFTHCTNIGVAESERGAHIRVFPNPTSDKIFFEFPNSHDVLRLELLDQTGRTIFRENLGSLRSLDVSELHSGAYVAWLSDGQGRGWHAAFSVVH